MELPRLLGQRAGLQGGAGGPARRPGGLDHRPGLLRQRVVRRLRDHRQRVLHQPSSLPVRCHHRPNDLLTPFDQHEEYAMNRRVLGALVAVLLAAMGTFVLLAYVRSAEDRALAGEQVVQVLTVRKAIAAGTPGDALEGFLTVTKVPAKVQANDSVTDVGELDGKVAAVDLVPGEQVLSSRFIAPEKLEAKGAVEVPEDLQEVTVPLTPERALAGRIKAGDTVGVVTSFKQMEDWTTGEANSAKKYPESTHLTLEKVLVTHVQGGVAPPSGDGEQAEPAAGNPGDALLVTLALDAPAVERLVFAAEHGTVWLSNDPETAPTDGTKVQTRGTVHE
ncbi:MAG: Flp pilus assembly protein CpaB [Nitriliruptorales bacterium]|nr:Flp pilus assembly protein CpaB [Nitriliruptorales bacterium]